MIFFLALERFPFVPRVTALALHCTRFRSSTRRRPSREMCTFIGLLVPAGTENFPRPSVRERARLVATPLFLRTSTRVTVPTQRVPNALGQ